LLFLSSSIVSGSKFVRSGLRKSSINGTKIKKTKTGKNVMTPFALKDRYTVIGNRYTKRYFNFFNGL
jgi:hypothetical protein